MPEGGKRMDPETLAEIMALEESLWRAATRFDDALMEGIFAPDFFEFGRSERVYTRAEMMVGDSALATIDATMPLPEFKARYLTDDVVHVTYISAVVNDGRTDFGNRSSIWNRMDGT